MAGSSVVSATAIDRDGRAWTTDELSVQIGRAMNGDRAALTTLETKFSASQSWWSYVGGDIAYEAADRLVRASTTNEFGRLAVRRTLERTCNELAGPCPTQLVSLAAQRVAMCKLEADIAYRTSVAYIASNEVPPKAVQDWLDRAETRCRKALRTLADLQRLQLPVVQFNVGGQQVNIATPQVNLPGRAAAPTPPSAADTPVPSRGPANVRRTRAGTRSRGLPEPADTATAMLESGEAPPSAAEAAEAALGNPAASPRSDGPTPETSQTPSPAAGGPSREGAPQAAPERAARRRGPAPRDRRRSDSRGALLRGEDAPELVTGDAGTRQTVPALASGRRAAGKRGRTRGPPSGSWSRPLALDSVVRRFAVAMGACRHRVADLPSGILGVDNHHKSVVCST